jgi:CDGSH-type Zn-finger protein/truncated hemoglobin YjbI
MTDPVGQPGQALAGHGRLAQVIATRGGRAAPEAPFVIEHREALIYMLCQAAELEHGIMCQYLFAAFSLKQSASEGLSDAELAAVTRWRKQISHVATQEMLHLALVQNLLSAIGAAPHLTRPNLPHPAGHYPAGVQLALLPFGEQALQHFMFLERPEGMDLDDADGLAAVDRAIPVLNERDIVPQGQDFKTVGHLYRSIEDGIARLAAKYGERWLFVGPPRAQATQQYFRWPELVAVTGLATAQRAIDTILEQGEGPRGDWRDAHFGQFVAILDEYQQMTAANPEFSPVRPVVTANVRPCERPVEVPLITDRLTARVTDLFNVGYEILLQAFERFFAHTEESDLQLRALADVTIDLMLRVIKPLGDLITKLPAGTAYPGRTVGPSFELFYEDDYLVPHREAAWALLAERVDEAAWLCEELWAGRGAHIAGELAPVGQALAEIAGTLAAHLPADSPQARHAAIRAWPDPAEQAAALAQARELAAAVAAAPRDRPQAAELAELFGLAHAAVLAAGRQPPGAGQRGDVVPRLLASVLCPLAGAIGPLPTGDASDTDATSKARPSTDAAPGDLVWAAATSATSLLAAQLRSGACTPQLAEATAALQALACDLANGPEAAARLAGLQEALHGLPAAIRTAPNGPYLVTNVSRLSNYLGEQVPAPPQLALCRCGGSSRKPFCDGTHARNGFTDDKDDKRVPDRRDTYPGQQVTIFDNRGLCQHSGFCTDRLATVFRAGEEPFVGPSGGRMDEIIRAVRDCPSGALGFAIDGREEQTQRDWGNTREPAIEITRDGPYRVTGGIGLADSGGGQIARNDGASDEHYALCRCGHSQNKPFCSGMHWYVGFTDPVPAADPTLFEWVGGLPALTRMTRLLYEKHIPADPLLAPAFATMPPGYPQAEARAMALAFGAPANGTGRGSDPPLAGIPGAPELTEEQRDRWVTLARLAAKQARLPADPEFHAAFVSYLEWSSGRAAVTSPAGPGKTRKPLLRWDWTPARAPVSPDPAAAAGRSGPAVTLPGPGEPVSFAAHIKQLFRDSDRKSMSFAFDLWNVDDVRAHAGDILGRLRDGSMPCDGAWPEDQVAVFSRWTEADCPP